MTSDLPPKLRRGWTTGACATAAVKATLEGLWGGGVPDRVTITLPRGETPTFVVEEAGQADSWAEAAIIKDAGDDPDVTHGALIRARVATGRAGQGIRFLAGDGVGIVTKPGLPIPPGEPAINPVPRQMMKGVIHEAAETFGKSPDLNVTISVRNGAQLAEKTWNPRLGIKGGLSILGTTGIVRPFSCAAWIASIHRGIDVARAEGLTHVAGCTGATSERVVQALYGLPDGAMLDMGDFVGGMLKYLARHPIRRATIGGGIGKLTKLAQGARDLHSGRSQVDFHQLSDWMGDPEVRGMNTALEAYEKHGKRMADVVVEKARDEAAKMLREADIRLDVVMIDRNGTVIGRAS
ncbi:cobalt-precorrin-5B C(1)-methyltransferase [Aliiroseovarius zhejiangensis]|uniref:Cobalt-precorrin-5B C(1)-methyltransferase n=1 Tax=Aliiroseovarius zhejiangensis TaxID=1632025 RepID=A0ABQ3IY33_9RHOB|nr:cobalt-precorrin-5B (C(1))-methyltransferase [Aliiroseovarius zhejiangensis]GHE94699.1 cobalt-precorrin-5B C(1)-methyltransferase [Aliiroseovarius zhejiangensis]